MAGCIIGYKTERFVTTRPYPGFVCMLVGHEVQSALHSTKGWRRSSHRRQEIGPSKRHVPPSILATRSTVSFKGFARGASAPLIELTPAAMERARMRHAWYRRQKEREARAAAQEAWNGN